MVVSTTFKNRRFQLNLNFLTVFKMGEVCKQG